ncbi:hypothetical protein CEXT_459131 [Caerostris extrusa]|uniref:Uncharacterized protein n=1 Tax=Caerostris extrusa TaxID=172846 RepID=A0AAV4Q9C8_CAEEX|nr:hypothetical protein CEXT_459131 [Caerostris extrusa]
MCFRSRNPYFIQHIASKYINISTCLQEESPRIQFGLLAPYCSPRNRKGMPKSARKKGRGRCYLLLEVDHNHNKYESSSFMTSGCNQF